MVEQSSKQILTTWCRYYGTFSGRWHSNKEWADLSAKLPTMTEKECVAQIEKIEQTAKQRLAEWQMYQ